MASYGDVGSTTSSSIKNSPLKSFDATAAHARFVALHLQLSANHGLYYPGDFPKKRGSAPYVLEKNSFSEDTCLELPNHTEEGIGKSVKGKYPSPWSTLHEGSNDRDNASKPRRKSALSISIRYFNGNLYSSWDSFARSTGNKSNSGNSRNSYCDNLRSSCPSQTQFNSAEQATPRRKSTSGIIEFLEEDKKYSIFHRVKTLPSHTTSAIEKESRRGRHEKENNVREHRRKESAVKIFFRTLFDQPLFNSHSTSRSISSNEMLCN